MSLWFTDTPVQVPYKADTSPFDTGVNDFRSSGEQPDHSSAKTIDSIIKFFFMSINNF
jgi:hypothetical protein